MVGCTVTANSGYGAGGIMVWGTGSMSIADSIVAGNTGNTSTPDYNGYLNSLDYNFIQNTNGATITGVTTHNLYGKTPLLAPLANNGGPTWTHALLPGSPAIDRGSSGGVTTDQRGQPRPFKFPFLIAAADGSDIGAYELQERAQTNWVVNGSSSNLVFTVNSTNDVEDGVPGIAHCSLREAINAANANPTTNTTMITFATNVPGISTGVTGTITLTNGQLAISKSVSINGPGMTNLTVSGNNSNRVFIVDIVSAAISGLTVANGYVDHDDGGGIWSYGYLTITSCTFSNNRAYYYGSAIYNKNALNLNNCLVCSNANSQGYGALWNDGGLLMLESSAVIKNPTTGIESGSRGTVNLANCTISGNAAGIGCGTFDSIYINSCTIISNSASDIDFKGTNHIRNSIIGRGPAGSSWVYSDDYNLIQNRTNSYWILNILGATNHCIFNQDPKLGPLAYLGGPTPTHPLRYDSPALNAGNGGGLTTDQRGLPRPIGTPAVAGGDGSDIGAYEADPNLRLTAIAKSGNDILLNFPTVFGRSYEIDGKNNLNGSWTMVTNNIPGSGGIMQAVEVGGADQPRRFYRAVQQ